MNGIADNVEYDWSEVCSVKEERARWYWWCFELFLTALFAPYPFVFTLASIYTYNHGLFELGWFVYGYFISSLIIYLVALLFWSSVYMILIELNHGMPNAFFRWFYGELIGPSQTDKVQPPD